MGASNHRATYDGTLTLAQVIQKIKERAENDRHEMGWGKGFDGIRFQVVTNPGLKTVDDVERAYAEVDKGVGVIVRVTATQIPYAARAPLKPFEAAMEEAGQAVQKFASALIVRMKEQKSKTRRCETCTSTIAVAYLRGRTMRTGYPRTTIACPVCDTEDFCVSATDQKRREALVAAHEKALAQLRAEEGKIGKAYERQVWHAYGWAND